MASQLDPSIILKAGNFSTPDYAKTMELRELVQGRHAAAAEQARIREAAAAAQQLTAAVGGIAASGDFAGAQKTALGAGDFDLASKVSGLDEKQKAQALEKVGAGLPVFAAALKLPPEQRKAAILAALPSLAVHGYTPEMLAAVDTSDAGLTGQIASGMKLSDVLKQQQDDRKFAYDKAHDAEQLGVTREGNYLSAGLMPPGEGGGVIGGTPSAVPGADQVWQNIVKIESGGRAGVLGPQTKYGQAQGLSQMLPTTAQAMAQKLGVPWQPELMTGKTPEAADYQMKLGRAYFDEGVEKYGGDLRKAAMYYHGGPDQSIWGPKTKDYALRAISSPGKADGLRIIPGGKLDKSARKDAPTGYRWKDDGTLESIPGGPADKQGRQANLKPPPVAATKAYIDNRTSIRKIADAFSAVNAYPDAVGFDKGMLPNAITSRTDPKGVDARAKISDIGSLLIHDRSGAAVTVAETPRLLPFVPQVGDTPQVVKTKLKNLRAALEETNSDIEDAYGEDQGYKFPTFKGGTLKPNNAAGGIPTFTPEQARNAPKGTRFRTSDGREMVRQ